MFYPFGPRPDQPSRVKSPRQQEERHDDDVTGNAGLDGFSRLSRADRETGYRPPVGAADPQWPRYPED
jgi:hypothetical protein